MDMLVKLYQRFRKHPIDFVGLGFILLACPAIYIYGVYWIIPGVLKDSSDVVRSLAYLAATWCLFGIFGHLYCVRTRTSSIKGRFLPQPIVATEKDDANSQNPSTFKTADGLHRRTQDINKTLGQQFMAKPFGSDEAWHICPQCEIYVPNRCWHCSRGCNTCILRRDHHCVFAMACIGEENHANFIGLVFYLAVGAIYAAVMLMLYSVHNFGVSYGWFLVKSFVPALFIWTDFSFHYVLSALSILGGVVAVGMLCAYILGATKGRTAADQKYSTDAWISLRGVSYQKFKGFLGPNPIWRIIWPFHTIYKVDYARQS